MPISREGELFRLDTEKSSYWFRVTPFGHLEHLHYGGRLSPGDPAPLCVKRAAVPGGVAPYDESDPCYCLDCLCLEWSGVGRGDWRQTPIELRQADGSFASDLLFESAEIFPGCLPMKTLPSAYGGAADCETLVVALRDPARPVTLKLVYTVYPAEDVICRRAVLKNEGEGDVSLRRIMSMSLDMPDRGFNMRTLTGGWISEAHITDRPVERGMYVNCSTTGASSNRANPGFLLAEAGASESHGRVWGFDLVYSGNHRGCVEKSCYDLVRVQLGIDPCCFDWTLGPGEEFETPEAVMAFSDGGYTGLSRRFHDFVNRRVVRGEWKERERPVLLNNWEATFFKFTRRRLLALARRGKRLGIELFVLDDGWFGDRNDDRAGLGDWDVNRRKLPGGLRSFARSINRMGLGFGLWMEPEMVNPDSKLYRAHPDWAVTTPGRKACMGRHQLLLDLTRPEVRDYIVENAGRTLDSAPICYVKWDWNRNMTDAFSPALSNQGEFAHRYVLGLYEVLGRIFGPRPHILLESCASGGNRFDLGMLCYSPQIWASDDTDPVERLSIQEGLSLFYPPSCIGAHVSAAPHQQTLRDTPLSARFNAACFGVLGYELDLKWLSPMEMREIKEQIAFYKQHRRTLQFGRFCRFDAMKDNKFHWQTTAPDGGEAVAGLFQTLARAGEGPDILPVADLEPDAEYTVGSKAQRVFIGRLGGLVKHVMPVELRPNGFILRHADRLYAMPDGVESYSARGDMLTAGLSLESRFLGTGYDPRLRMWGDFGSTLYVISKL